MKDLRPQGRGAHDHLQVFPTRKGPVKQPQRKVDVQGPLMGLIHHDALWLKPHERMNGNGKDDSQLADTWRKDVERAFRHDLFSEIPIKHA